jgi:hypothetical protein
MTTATESLTQEYDRLLDERSRTAAEMRSFSEKGEVESPESRTSLAAIRARLKEIVATAPAGYDLPRQATELIELAGQHGWISMIQWTPPGWDGDPFVEVHVGRRGGSAGNYYYKITWHSRDCAPGKLRLRSKIAQVPGRQAWHDAPSLKAIRDVIAANGGAS